MRLDRLAVRGDRRAGGGDGDGADDVGAAALVAGGARGPRDAVGRDARRRAAAAQVGRAGVEPVAASGQHAGAERRVQLVAGEGDVVDAAGGDVDGPVRRELRRVDEHAGAVPLGDGHHIGQRPQLTGDVRGAGDDDQPVRRDRRGQRGGEVLQRVLDARRHRERRDLDAARLLPGQQRRVVLGLEDEHLGARAGRLRASRLVESVVLRVNTTRSSSRAPTNRATSTRACSYHAEVTRLAYPLPRWTDEYVCRAVSTAALTLTSDGVDAAWSRLAYSTSPVRVGTRRPAPTTAGSSPGAAVRTASPSRTTRSLVGMVGAQYVYSLRAIDMIGSEGLRDLPGSKVRACRRRMPAAGSSSGAPHRGGGLLASKPELCAGTHDRGPKGSEARPPRERCFRDLRSWADPRAATDAWWGACDA